MMVEGSIIGAIWPREDLAKVVMLELDIHDDRGQLSSEQLSVMTERLIAACSWLGVTGEVRVRVVGDSAMAAAHERYSGVAGTTDVLTFDLRSAGEREGEPNRMDVDVLVCLDEARRQTALRGHLLEHEILLYIVHGVLHCLGHDDHDDAAFARMHALEDEVLTAIGVGPIFGAGPASEGK